MLGQYGSSKRLVLSWNETTQIVSGHGLVLIGHGVWNDQVDAIRLSINMLVNPIQLDLKLLGGVTRCTKDAHSSRLRHGAHHVTAMSKCNQWKFDPQLLANR